MKPQAEISACRASHQTFLNALATLTDDDYRQPSLLPGFSRGHVTTHVANKARAHVWVFGGPPAGEIRQLHRDGYNADRAADAGARRSAVDLRADVAQSFEMLEAAWDGLDDSLWDREALMMAGPRTMAEIVRHQWRNVEVHHVDLDVGYEPANWPDDFVEVELSKRLQALPERAEHAELLAWLLGRAPAPKLHGSW